MNMDHLKNNHQHPMNNDDYLSMPSTENTSYNHSRNLTLSDSLDLGPLPSKWEKAYTKNGEVYFIDHNKSTSHWLDPRLSKFQKKQLEDCLDDELPFGWERIDDPVYGTYYIDHVNRLTQYENPVLQAKNTSHGDQINKQNEIPNHASNNFANINSIKHDSDDCNNFFTNNPHKLIGERIHSTLVKSSRGLGFTIIGGDNLKDEFLQIKSLVPNGPAWLEGKLKMGDVIVYVNEKCVLGYTHNDMVTVFQSISPGETVYLEVCRGYPLPFDPNDPCTEIVTTVAVGNSVDQQLDDLSYVDRELYMMKIDNRSSNDLCNQSIKSMPDLYASEEVINIPRPCSTDLILEEHNNVITPLYLTMSIVKGSLGFGFTIADSANGQKVKKILDVKRCQDLMEGDILVEINNIIVRNMSHTDVVQVLKDCQTNLSANIVIQRYIQNTPEKFRVKNKKDVKNMYKSKTPLIDSYNDCNVNRPKTPVIDNRTQISNISHNVHENGSSENYLMTNNIPFDDYCQREDDSWAHENSPSNQIYIPTSMYNGLVDHSTGFYMNPQSDHSNGHYANSQSDNYSNHLSKSIQSVSFENYEMNTSNNGLRYLHNNNDINEIDQINNANLKPNISYVTLQRQECGFGFRIVGGKEENSQVSIGHIVPGGAADLDGRIMTGDQIISIDGKSTVNTSHDYVINLISQCRQVILGIRHTKPNYMSNITKQHFDIEYPYDVTLTKNEKEGFGFVVISSLNKGPTIGRIIEGSPAFINGKIHVGDSVLAVNNTIITNLSHGDIVNMIKDSGSTVKLTIGPPNDDVASTISLPMSNKDLEEEQYHAIELSKGSYGFGFSIRGGREFQNMSLFVLQIAENGSAALDGRLKVGDYIIEINGVNTKHMTHAEAIDIIHSGGSSVRLLVKRGVKVQQLPSESNFYSTYNVKTP